MVSPAKKRQHTQPPTSSSVAPATTRNAATRSAGQLPKSNNVRIQKGPKPLEKKIFYLDIKNNALSSKLEARIKELGGEIELFLVKNVSIVVTDRPDKPGQAANSDKHRWGYASGGSGGPPSLRSIEVQTPTPTPPTPYRSVEGPLSNSTNQRGLTPQRSKSRVDAMLERALTQPQQCSVDPLSNAASWGIPIWSTYELHTWLGKISASLKNQPGLKRDNRTGSGKEVKIKQLKEPYIKFESYRRETRPVFVELQSWPTLNFDGDPGSCPFDLERRVKKEAYKASTINKEIKENREKYFNLNISKGKDMTRRPRPTATARARKTENTGYCEICRIDYRNLSKHLQSDQHLNFIRNDKNFISLDNLISTGASVEAFLKINRSRDVRDCHLFPDRDHSLDNGILSSDEKSEKREKSSLNDYNIEEIKIMQCNGARRNLNSKLDSPHNLRTRAKHESGHLLRSKGKPSDEDDKNERSSEKYVVKKRAKGIMWIEEDSDDNDDPDKEQVGFDGKPLFSRLDDSETKKNLSNGEDPSGNITVNGDINPDTVECKQEDSSHNVVTKDDALEESFIDASLKNKVNGYERKRRVSEVSISHSAENNETKKVNLTETNTSTVNHNCVDNDIERLLPHDTEDTNSLKSIGKDGKSKPSRRGGRCYRGRQRLSVEERLLEDNKDYYKVEVLGNKLRSSAIPSSNILISPSKEQITDKSKREDKPSSEKPVVVRFKRVRKSELSLLSDEAESFMFGEPKRDDESSDSDGEHSSVLPKDTESDGDQAMNSLVLSSSPDTNINLKQELQEDDSTQDSTATNRSKKRRRTQAEALLTDNTDYYKFEVPGSRLRYQAPLAGICESESITLPGEETIEKAVEKIYPSKPSPEVEKMHFSFEATPRSEPWYQTYQRQDDGAEYYYSLSECDPKPFLLPYEIENFHEILQKSILNSAHRKRGRSRGGHVNMGCRSPRKSPRCHASTLAIMSTIIRRREPTLSTIEENGKVKIEKEAAKSEKKSSEKKLSEKSDVDEDIKEIVKNLDDMLSNDDQDLDSFEVDFSKTVDDIVLEPEVPAAGAPENLLELLDNCHALNGIENSSCASSECGELGGESPMKRRKKKRKNKTGWPGNKMRRKLHLKHLAELQREMTKKLGKKSDQKEKDTDSEALENPPSEASLPEEEHVAEKETDKDSARDSSSTVTKLGRGRRIKNRESKECKEELVEESDSKSKSVSCEEPDPKRRKILSESSEKCKIEVEEVETGSDKRRKHLSSISEDSEASLSNNENVCTKSEISSPRKGRSLLKGNKKRKRSNTTSSETSQQTEIESNQQSSASSPSKKQKKNSSESQELSSSQRMDIRKKGRRRMKQHLLRSPVKVILKSKISKKQSFLSASDQKRLAKRTKRARRNDSVSSETLLNGETDSRDSTAASSDVDQRRSSIDFQPVVRVMKIDDQVDIDSNSVLSVTVSTNRRLRSSSSPMASMQPPKKRFRHGASKRRNMPGQWLKNS